MIASDFLVKFLSEVFRLPPGRSVRVLDLGCGRGELVNALRSAGYEARGTDFEKALPSPCPELLHALRATTGTNSSISYEVYGTYSLPFADESFDVVVSTSVLEHVRNIQCVLQEIRRVLLRTGVTIHSFPGRYYLPHDPHTYVPLVPALWPYSPRLLLALSALAGIRTPSQNGKDWKVIYRENHDYCRDSLEYRSIRRYEELFAAEAFRDVRCHFEYYVDHAPGGYAKLLRHPMLRTMGAALLECGNSPVISCG
jgi:SAM-dependent methyltransferase